MTVSNTKVSEDTSVTFTGWASTGDLTVKPYSYHPQPLRPEDVEIEITHCGICASDTHTINGDWGPLKHGPCIAGHELVGKVIVAGKSSRHQVGDIVGAGGLIEACGQCNECKKDLDQFCKKKTFIFDDTYKNGRNGISYGGFADRIRLDSKFVYKIPPQILPAEAGPLMCAGLTTYTPLKHLGAGPGKKVGIIGIGGLGHLGIQWARAMNCDEVVAISTGESKRKEAKQLGATRFLNFSKPEEIKAAAELLDIVLCTGLPDDADWGQYLSLVANHGKFVVLCVPNKPICVPGLPLIYRDVAVVGSLIGSRKDNEDMLQFAAEKNVRPWIEKMPMSDANAALKHSKEGRPRYRVVMETVAASRL
ncbi:hypothetical protein BX616_002491 [Lobosporangium transversale]|uniref:Chaperonin 10-like protein n=1 Tax=Lobosporangium transversale TaxID=64571 RepID=A0A1Y2GPU4_9FUNG|nr:hypothetical protein BCR41DRAFT_335598 [Lobosporangium transversale]KAF9900808.1 hypothetical protein BX616_002491 [Lobosporangium transversale]ORZ18312.1 hypothetical protein BCR41DRAFT_335598 [Lobosporangium transversale]|eukprot:XP_021882107.1 hypothetical protein BCR41DRAFT_335598 [Lobosporangium transversale]